MIYKEISPLVPLYQALKEEKRPVFLYGMGNGAEKIYAYLREKGVEIKGIVASDGFLRGQSFLGYDVISVSQAETLFGSLCLVICFGLEGEKSRFLQEIAKKHRIVSPNLPVFGDVVCDKDYILENIEKFQRVYNLFEDDTSREIFLNLLKYNVTGDISYLSFGNDASAPEGFYKHGKRHIDIGAYDGDTVAEFISHSQSYADIIAFEPDGVTFKKLQRNIKDVPRVNAENMAVSRRSGFTQFDGGNGRASHCGEGGESVATVSVDEYCGFTHINAKGVDVGSIKIDAEGMDEDVICGSVNTLYCCKSNVCVALYHRGQDLAELPLLLRKHNFRYKFFLRKKEYIPAWDVFLYAIDGFGGNNCGI